MPTLQQASAEATHVPPRPNRYSRWRAATLIGVYLLIGLHIAHWQIAGQTLAPLELHEVMYTFELGVVTAGFLFMAAAVLSAMLFGRFFCSWACHILALEDLCAWLLRKLRLRPKPVRSRVLRLVPFVALFYMFVWPQVLRIASGQPMPTLHVAPPEDPWPSFVTQDFWRNLPGPWITVLTFLVCGFAIVYVLGSRGFCTNACPYGALFGLADRLSPGRIVRKGECTGCGVCTTVCTSGVLVHEEIQRHGKIVDPGCLKDLDCVAACPDRAIGFGFTSPALFRSRKGRGKRRRFHLTWGEDVLVGAVLLGSLIVFRGLYDVVPFLMSLGLACLLAWLAVLGLRLARGQQVTLGGKALRSRGRLTGFGRAIAAGLVLVAALVLHSGYVRYHQHMGDRAFEAVRTAMEHRRGAAMKLALDDAVEHLETCATWGLWVSPHLDRRLASLHQLRGDAPRTEFHLRRILAAEPRDHEARLRLATTMIAVDRLGEAAVELEAVERDTSDTDLLRGAAAAHARLAEALDRAGDPAAAVHQQRVEQLRLRLQAR